MLNTNFQYEPNNNYNFPNITIYNILADGVLDGYEARANEGYVMYDENDIALAPLEDENGNPIFDEYGNIIEVEVKQYYRLAGFPLNYNFANFSWVAELYEEGMTVFNTPENKPKPEIM